MYQMFSRSGRREKKKPRLPPKEEEQQLGKPAAARRDGYVQKFASRNACDCDSDDSTKLEEESFALEFQLTATKRRNMTTKGLAGKCISKAMKSKRSSPSLVAKLMGLDTFPTPKEVDKQLNIVNPFEASPSAVFFKNDTTHEVRPSHSEINENREFKDVFEVMDTANPRKDKNRSSKKDKLNYRKDEADIDLVKQMFLDAKRLSTNEALQQSKEFDDALEILDSNKDLLLEFLQHPNSLFAKHLQDFKHELPSRPCQITILKSSKSLKCGSRELWSRSEINLGNYSDLQKEVAARGSPKKPAINLTHNSNKDYNDSCLKSSSGKYAGKSGSRNYPTRIVILKPNLEKAKKVSGAVSFEQKSFHSGYRTHPGTQELHKKGRENQKLSESSFHKPKGSSEITEEITTEMRQNIIRRSRRAVSEMNANAWAGSSSILSDDSKLEKNESFGQLSGLSDELSGFLPSPCSSESYVVREARKRLSERWKVARRFQEMGLVSKGSSTLSEMLAQSDWEEPKTFIDLLSTKKNMDEKFGRDENFERKDRPLGISSNDGWKDANYRKFSRSKSLPSSTTASDVDKSSNGKGSGGSSNYYMLKDVLNMGSNDFPHAKCISQGESPLQSSFNYSNKHRPVHLFGEESLQPEREIHVNSEESRKITSARCLSDEESMDFISTDESVIGSRHIICSDSFTTDREPIIEATEVERAKQFAVQVPAQDEEFSGLGCKDVATQGCHSPIPCPPEPAEYCVPHSSKEVDKPSPVSFLEPSSDEESSTSGCFERISADLQELRMQLKLLKLESGRACADESDTDISSDEGDDRSFVSTEEATQRFRNEDERDFSYVLDMLVHSGIHGTNKDRIFDCCSSSTEYPVDQDVLDKLEKKYSAIPSWSRSERRLLFDTTNCMLSTLATPSMDLHPLVKSKRQPPAREHLNDLVEAVWQMVVKQRKEVGSNREVMLDSGWLGLEDEIECVGKEIEKVICDDLFEEIFA